MFPNSTVKSHNIDLSWVVQPKETDLGLFNLQFSFLN